MKIFSTFLFIFFSFLSLGFAEESRRHKDLAEDLSQSLAIYEALSRTAAPGRPDMRGRDPFEPLADAQGNILNPSYLNTELAVQGIVNSGGPPMALINGKLYSVDDVVNRCRVLEIRPDGVVVQDEKSQVFIPLYPDPSKEGPGNS